MKFISLLTWGALSGGAALVAAQETTTFTQEELYNLTSNFWDNFMYPNNCAQSQSINSSLLADNIEGRIDATRTFVGAELNTEYLFGLFCNLQSNSGFNVLGAPLDWKFTQFVAQGNLVSNTVLINFNLSSLNLISPIQIQSYINFDADGKLSQYDAVFKWLDWQFTTLIAAGAVLLGTTNTTVVQETITNLVAESICTTEVEYCVGDLQQYADKDACLSFLTTQVPFGEAWQLGMNTLVCRDLHVNMLPFRPDVHCAHVGPTGGGYCSDERDYSTYVTDPFFSDQGAMLQIPAAA